MMRLSLLLAVLPAVLAQNNNPFTKYLTETNSLGVVTGMPDIPALPTLPPAASIPSGFSSGVATVWVAPSKYAVISVHDSTTEVISAITTSTLDLGTTPGKPGSASVSLPTSVTTSDRSAGSSGKTTTTTTKKGGLTTSTTKTSTKTTTTKKGKKGGMTSAPTKTKGSKGGAPSSSSSGAAVAGAVGAQGAVIGAAGILLAML